MEISIHEHQQRTVNHKVVTSYAKKGRRGLACTRTCIYMNIALVHWRNVGSPFYTRTLDALPTTAMVRPMEKPFERATLLRRTNYNYKNQPELMHQLFKIRIE